MVEEAQMRSKEQIKEEMIKIEVSFMLSQTDNFEYKLNSLGLFF